MNRQRQKIRIRITRVAKVVLLLLLGLMFVFEYAKLNDDILLTLDFDKSIVTPVPVDPVISFDLLSQGALKFKSQILDELLHLRSNLYFKFFLLALITILEIIDYRIRSRNASTTMQ